MKYIIVVVVGILLVGYGAVFHHYQGEYFACAEQGEEFSIGLDRVPLLDLTNMQSVLSFNQALEKLSNPEGESETLFLEAAKNPGLASDSYFNLGNYYLTRNDVEKCLGFYEQAIRVNSENMDAKYNWELLMKLLEQQGKMPGDAMQGEGSGEEESFMKVPGTDGKEQEDVGW